MKKFFALFLLAASAFAASDELERALQPLREGVPQVAVVRLRALLSGKLSAEEKRAALHQLGQALAASGENEKALEILRDPSLRDFPANSFYRAQGLAALGKWPEGLEQYRAELATNPPSAFAREALMGEGEALRALGRREEALKIYARAANDPRNKTRAHIRSAELFLAQNDNAAAMRMLETAAPKRTDERKEIRFLRAQIESRLGHRKRALELLAWTLKHPEGAPHSVLVAALFAIADEHLNAGTPGTGDDFLEDYIEHNPESADLPAIFAKLDQLYAAERRQSRHDLGRWSRENAQPRRALSLWYLARAELRLNRRDMALQSFERLREEHASVSSTAAGLLEFARLKMEDARYDQAAAILQSARTLSPVAAIAERIDFFAGEAEFRAQKFSNAAEIFQRVAHNPENAGPDARFNASLAWLEASDEKKLEQAETDLRATGADTNTLGDLALEKGLAAAAHGDRSAGDELRNFLRDHPQHARAAEAWVALAELAFHQTPPQLEEARQNLAKADAANPSARAQERSDYLALWMEDAAPSPNESKVIERATQFLQKYPTSSSAAEVRLKLAETFYRRQDFASAETQFTLLAQLPANPALAEKAKFFAAQSASQSMGTGSLERALLLFGEVVQRGGEWKWAARNEQAVIERKLGKIDDAVTLYDEVLKGDGKAAEKREALCGKADMLYDLGANDANSYRRAIDLYTQLAGETDAATHWHNQALFKKGMCQEKLQQPAEALATFYQIVEDAGRPDKRREFFWYYKAGFNAARLLEEQSQWPAAAAIYEKLSFAGGTRSEEAKARLHRLRLEHFLWEE